MKSFFTFTRIETELNSGVVSSCNCSP